MRGRDTQVDAGGSVLEVRYEDRTMGRLTRRDGVPIEESISFAYDPDWTATKGAFPLSVSMPTTVPEHAGPKLYNWFLGLLPESTHRKLVGGILKVDATDVFAMIGRMGFDLPGAIEIVREGGSLPDPRYRSLTDAELAEAIAKLPMRPMLAGEDGIHMSLAGVQSKLAVAKSSSTGRIALALDGAASTHILKPAIKELRDSVENEAFCLRLARAVGLDAPEVTIGAAGEHRYILVARYDRFWDPKRKRIRRLAQEDLCQAMGLPPELKYESDRITGMRGPGVADCFRVLGATTVPAASRSAFLDQFVFNVLVGNTDAHAKNYSLLHAGRGSGMSPIYDVLSCGVWDKVTRRLPMKVAGKDSGRHLCARHWDRFSVENGLSPAAVRKRVGAMADRLAKEAPKLASAMGAEYPSMVYAEIVRDVDDICRRTKHNLVSDPLPEEIAESVGEIVPRM